jgi:hypothetical protein
MALRRTIDRNAVQPAGNEARAGNAEILALPAARSEQEAPLVEPYPILQAVVLSRDLIAERAQAIWLKRGCPRNRDEENWREAKAQLRTEMGIV